MTPLPANVATALMVTALREREPKPERVAQHLLSLVWIETGAGTKMVQNNWGNLTGEYEGNFWRPAWFKVDASSSARMRELNRRMLAGKAPSKFRAYPSRGDGLEDFVRLMYQPRYAPMLNAARAGDTIAFADAVHSTGYCPDPECRGPRTIASYQKLTNKFAPMLGLEPSGTMRLASGGKGGGIALLLLVWALAKGKF